MQILFYGLAAFGAYRIVVAAVQTYLAYKARQRLAFGSIYEVSQQIAELIAKIPSDHHGRMFAQIGNRLVDLNVLYTAGACYRIGLEIYPEMESTP